MGRIGDHTLSMLVLTPFHKTSLALSLVQPSHLKHMTDISKAYVSLVFISVDSDSKLQTAAPTRLLFFFSYPFLVFID